MKNTIILFDGKFQYEVVNEFQQSVKKEFEQIGYNVEIMNLKESGGPERFFGINPQSILCCIGFNGIYSDLKVAGESFFNTYKIPFIYWLVDHPVHLIERLQENIKYKIVVCVDETHCNFIEKHFPNTVSSFLPHAANITEHIEEKKYDVMFAGHLVSEAEMQSMAHEIDNLIKNLPHVINDRVWHEGNIDLQQLMNELYEVIPNADYLFGHSPSKESFLLSKVDRYIRASKRYAILSKLLEHDVKIHYFGNLPTGHSFNDKANFVQQGSLTYKELQKAMNQSKIVLNVFPNFPLGGHERIFEATSQNALVMSDRNGFIEECFPNALLFDIDKLEETMPSLKELLNDDSLRQQKVIAMQNDFKAGHTWRHRVEQLEFIVKSAIDYFNTQ